MQLEYAPAVRAAAIGIAGCLFALLMVKASLSCAQYAEEEETTDPRGDLAALAAGGTGGALLAGSIVYGFYSWADSCPESSSEEDVCGAQRTIFGVFPAILAAPFLISGGVALAGKMTGGTGTFLATSLGLVGLLPGLLTLLAGDNAETIGVGIGLLPIGYVAGAIVGYRWSADDPSPSPAASVALLPVPYGALLTLGGGF